MSEWTVPLITKYKVTKNGNHIFSSVNQKLMRGCQPGNQFQKLELNPAFSLRIEWTSPILFVMSGHIQVCLTIRPNSIMQPGIVLMLAGFCLAGRVILL